MILYIDTTNNLKTIVGINNKRFVSKHSSPREQNVLSFIDSVLKKNNVRINNIKSIKVNPGPGSFTGTRVGVAIANALAISLNVPINGKKPPIKVNYGSPPNITKPKEQTKTLSSNLEK